MTVETLQGLVNGSLGGVMASIQEGGGAGPVCLPRRAETFGGFDSHQMHSSKSRSAAACLSSMECVSTGQTTCLKSYCKLSRAQICC